MTTVKAPSDRIWLLDPDFQPRWYRSPEMLAKAVIDKYVHPGSTLIEYRLRGSTSAQTSQPVDMVSLIGGFMAGREFTQPWPAALDTAAEKAAWAQTVADEKAWRKRTVADLTAFIEGTL